MQSPDGICGAADVGDSEYSGRKSRKDAAETAGMDRQTL
jgi:hypothetical protein